VLLLCRRLAAASYHAALSSRLAHWQHLLPGTLLTDWIMSPVLLVSHSSDAGVLLPLCHASLRSPNLKARLASAREEFRAVW